MQVYLQLSKAQPNFCLQSKRKLVQAERKCKFTCNFSKAQPNFCLQSKLKLVQAERKCKQINKVYLEVV